MQHWQERLLPVAPLLLQPFPPLQFVSVCRCVCWLSFRVLDLFCGSGALAIESLSRGAQQAVLVDRSLDCCEVS